MSRFLSRGNLPRRRHRDTARLAQDLLRATRLSQSLPRWVGPPLVKTKFRLLCNFFSIRDSLLFPQSKNRPFCGRFTAISSRYPCFAAPKQSLIAKKLQFGPFFLFSSSQGGIEPAL